MLTVACVKWGTLYGPNYVNVLYDMVRRNLPHGFPGRFVCLTDDPTGLEEGIQVLPLPRGLSGWWNKLYLFAPETFPAGERILYFDLDTCITAPLDAIAEYRGPFAILRDAYRPDGLQSSVMAWEAGKFPLWQEWHRKGCPMDDRGDQGFLEDVGIKLHDKFQDLFPGRFRSYKVDCRNEIPRGASVVFFHGHPRPHEVTDGWVPHVWKIGGGSGLEFVVQSNTPDDELAFNVQWAKENAHTWLRKEPGHLCTALIVGGGPSLEEQLFRIRGMQMAGAKMFACGNTARYLLDHGIEPNAQVILDARKENAEFIADEVIPVYAASQCAPETLKRAGMDLTCYHAMQSSYLHLLQDTDLIVGGGSTVGLKAIAVAFLLGYRTFHLFGFDSCYRAEAHHAYPQTLNDGERRVEAKVGEATFQCAPWMVTQAEEFKELAATLVSSGCVIVVHGEGLIPAIAASLAVPPSAPDIRAQEILKRINGHVDPVGVEVGVFMGALSTRLLSHPELTLYMVDSWSGDHSEAYKASGDFHTQLTQVSQDRAYELTQGAVQFAGPRAKIIRAASLEAARQFPNASLDFVFLDADHSYEAVKADIRAWWPKIKSGGFLSGHDYDNTEFPGFGVKQAVDERFPQRELGENFTWFVRKTEDLT